MIVATDVTGRYHEELHRVLEIQAKVSDCHPLLEAMYPLVLAEDDVLHVFTPDANDRSYILASTQPAPMRIPQGVRAAFPLDSLGGAAACVVTADAFASPQGYVEILHEFVHCYQWETCERRLRESLGVARKALATHDSMWEIHHAFPYAHVEVAYRRWIDGLEADGPVAPLRSSLRAQLADEDWEYLVWQEWKEGFARYVENCVRARLELLENRNGHEGSVDRTSFYAGGALYITHLLNHSPRLATDLEELFRGIRDSHLTEEYQPRQEH